jgi:hypothetical protein
MLAAMAAEDRDGEPGDLELVGHEVSPDALEVRPAASARDWMDATDVRFAYRCLPLTLANQLGWELLCPVSFSAVWDGSDGTDGVAIRFHEEASKCVDSHFGYGVLTFSVGILFRTPPAHDLWVKGPANRVKDGIAPLEGLVETDWAPSTFTMNWKFTRPDAEVTFEAGEAIACLVPYPRGYIERFQPALRPIEDDPVLQRQYGTWSESRGAFLASLVPEGAEARRARWQKHYMLGQTHEGERRADHATKLRVRAFARTRRSGKP